MEEKTQEVVENWTQSQSCCCFSFRSNLKHRPLKDSVFPRTLLCQNQRNRTPDIQSAGSSESLFPRHSGVASLCEEDDLHRGMSSPGVSTCGECDPDLILFRLRVWNPATVLPVSDLTVIEQQEVGVQPYHGPIPGPYHGPIPGPIPGPSLCCWYDWSDDKSKSSWPEIFWVI